MPREMDDARTVATTNDAIGRIDAHTVDGKQFARVHMDGKTFLLPSRCPHRGAPISEEGRVVGKFIVCGRRGATFDLRTGKWLRGAPARTSTFSCCPRKMWTTIETGIATG